MKQSDAKQGGLTHSNKIKLLQKRTTAKHNSTKQRPAQPHADPRTPLPRQSRKAATFVQPKLEHLASKKLCPNDAFIIDDLKDRMLNYMLEEKAEEKR